MKKYLQIKNALIAILVTAIYLSWTVEGISIVKIVVACAAVFISMMRLLALADRWYMKANKKSASDCNP